MKELAESRWPNLFDRYCKNYCEENIWHLCNELPRDVLESHVAFISNSLRLVAVWCQRAADAPDEALLWDYHVILLVRREEGWGVIDPDSIIASPCPAAVYLADSFPMLPEKYEQHLPMFRLVPSEVYVAELCSDRSHMRAANGDWASPPPPGPCIGNGTNLMRFVDMEADFLGDVCDLAGLRDRLGID